MELDAILASFEDALELERELGVRTVELDRALLRPASVPPPAPPPVHAVPPPPVRAVAPAPATPPSAPLADFAFLLEGTPQGEVAELLPKMSAAIGYGPDGVKINDPAARVLIVLGAAALAKWLPGVHAIPGQWVSREGTPALVTASPTKTYRFYGNNPAKIRQLKLRLWADLKQALARIGKTPPRN